MQVQPYVFYDGRCEEALEFYRKTLGAEVTALLRFKDSPTPGDQDRIPAGNREKVMHAAFRVGETQVLASDGHIQAGGDRVASRCSVRDDATIEVRQLQEFENFPADVRKAVAEFPEVLGAILAARKRGG